MKTKIPLGTALAAIILLGLMAPLVKADTLVNTDFEQESFSKTVDYMEYVDKIRTPADRDAFMADVIGDPTCI